MRARLPKNPVTPAASLRQKLGMTQSKIAGLLGISKNTWIRWEKGKCKPDGEALEVLSYYAKHHSFPTPCGYFNREFPSSPAEIAHHIRYCKRCRLSVRWITILQRRKPCSA